MKPIDFDEQTKVLTKPAGMTDEQCGSLPVFCNGEQIISRWQMSWWERIKVFCSGKIWVSVWSGHTSPPICPMIDTPFANDSHL